MEVWIYYQSCADCQGAGLESENVQISEGEQTGLGFNLKVQIYYQGQADCWGAGLESENMQISEGEQMGLGFNF